jgi:hypothetical protein
MRCCRVLGLHKLLKADGLACEEDKHASGRCQEEETTSELLAQESGQNSPEQIPDREDTINEQLCTNED